jgi:hypothetical protein
MSKLPDYRNVLIISGTGRNVGKTSFVCLLINNLKVHEIIAVKISPHFHDIENKENIIVQNNNFEILKETRTDGKKDSSKMLLSGAKDVFYIQAQDENIYLAFKYLHDNFICNKPVVFESASIGKYILPAFHFVVTSSNQVSEKKQFTDIYNPIIIQNINNKFDFDFDKLSLIEDKWNLL